MSQNKSNTNESRHDLSDHKAIIGKTHVFDGNINGDEDLRIEGTLEGTVVLADAKVIVAKGGIVRGDIVASTIYVQGEVRGELRGNDIIEIAPCGVVHGDIRAPRVLLQDGCQFKGLVDMDHNETAKKEKGKHVSNTRMRATQSAKAIIPSILPKRMTTS